MQRFSVRSQITSALFTGARKRYEKQSHGSMNILSESLAFFGKLFFYDIFKASFVSGADRAIFDPLRRTVRKESSRGFYQGELDSK